MKKISLVLLVTQILVVLLFWRMLPPEVPLIYSRPWGKEQLISPIGLFLLPCFSFIVFLLNFALIKFISKEEKLLQQILASSTTVFNLLCLITLIQIIRLVI